MVNLSTLAPEIVEAILDVALPVHLTLFDLAVYPPALWEEQRLRIWSGGDCKRIMMATDSKIAISVSGDSTLRYLSQLQSSHSSRLALRPATPSKFHHSQTSPTPYSPFLTMGLPSTFAY